MWNKCRLTLRYFIFPGLNDFTLNGEFKSE